MIASSTVALRKESVDRNFYYADKDADWVRSLSARRAWIEILIFNFGRLHYNVALRKESVDRNASKPRRVLKCDKSLSARRAWIEIAVSMGRLDHGPQSLSARRAWIEI